MGISHAELVEALLNVKLNIVVELMEAFLSLRCYNQLS